ncbi:MAG: hypothetical protein E6230_04025 [Paenibacillus dendritiformis]|uniref:hypothetical protein n=1 Tax=uncultured Paenibacillus sp. TaxID=227322 RepID=UPI0025F40881|nr:hypothetical protein [uncultured Paenibacillus sp.]MDU5141335.1 hypothetical protein [Paenibacillus dendritiformis]
MCCQEDGVLAAGSGPILHSLVEAWVESGLSKLAVWVINPDPADPAELEKLREHALRSNPDASLHIVAAAEGEEAEWRPLIQPCRFILYVSQHGDVEELRRLQQACIEERKPMLPAVALHGRGLAGPLLQPDGEGRWDSAWRGIHSSMFPAERNPERFPAAAGAVLANLLVHEWHKAVAEENETDCRNQCYILDPDTLTGLWHPIRPHPLVSGVETARLAKNIEESLQTSHEPADPGEWFSCLSRLTSPATGLFHRWEEADIIQLPLAQCLVQAVDPMSEGPAQLLPAIIRGGLTHEEARREAGLAGLEAYAARLMPLLFPGLLSSQREDIGIGAGCSIAEAVERGFRACLTTEWRKRMRMLADKPAVARIECGQIEDVRCRYYLQALRMTEGEPQLAAGEPLLGCPVVWVHSGSSWYGSADLDLTLALRHSLLKALTKTEGVAASSVMWKEEKALRITVTNSDPSQHAPRILAAVQRLSRRQRRLEVFDMRSESFLGTGPFVIYGVRLGEEESP